MQNTTTNRPSPGLSENGRAFATAVAPERPTAPDRNGLSDRDDGPNQNGRSHGAVEAPERPQTAPPPPAPAAPASPEAVETPTAPRGGFRRRLRNLLLVLLALLALGIATVVGYRWYEDSIRYVSTDNAQVTGPMIQVGGLEAGRVAAVRFDVGDRVNQNDVVAQLTVPVSVSMLPNGAPNQQFTGTTDTLVDVRSPVTGIVVARTGNPGDTMPAGQPLLTVVPPNQLWVTANVEETQVRKLQPGQPVVVHVDNIGADLTGHVAAVAQASAQSFSVIPQQNLSGNYTKVTQLQPVKILLDQTDPRLAVGTSAEVKIQVAS